MWRTGHFVTYGTFCDIRDNININRAFEFSMFNDCVYFYYYGFTMTKSAAERKWLSRERKRAKTNEEELTQSKTTEVDHVNNRRKSSKAKNPKGSHKHSKCILYVLLMHLILIFPMPGCSSQTAWFTSTTHEFAWRGTAYFRIPDTTYGTPITWISQSILSSGIQCISRNLTTSMLGLPPSSKMSPAMFN